MRHARFRRFRESHPRRSVSWGRSVSQKQNWLPPAEGGCYDVCVNQRWTGIGIAVAAAVVIVIGAFHPTWVTGRDFGIQSDVGLRSIRICQDVQPNADELAERSCESVTFAEWGDSAFAPKGFGTFRTLCLIAFFSGLATAVMLLLCAGLSGADKWVHWFIQPSSAVILLSMGTGLAAVLALAMNPFTRAGWGTGPGFLIMGGGATGGLLAGIMLGRLKPPDEDLFDPPFDSQ